MIVLAHGEPGVVRNTGLVAYIGTKYWSPAPKSIIVTALLALRNWQEAIINRRMGRTSAAMLVNRLSARETATIRVVEARISG